MARPILGILCGVSVMNMMLSTISESVTYNYLKFIMSYDFVVVKVVSSVT